MGQGALSKPVVQRWLSLNSSMVPGGNAAAGTRGHGRVLGSRGVRVRAPPTERGRWAKERRACFSLKKNECAQKRRPMRAMAPRLAPPSTRTLRPRAPPERLLRTSTTVCRSL